LEYETLKISGLCQFLECQTALHKRKAPC